MKISLLAVIVVGVFVCTFLTDAAAQTSGAHAVTLGIPNILKLKLSDGVTGSRADVDIDIRVLNGAFEVTPAASRVQVMANSAWQLSASYVPASADDAAAQLMWRTEVETGWQPFTPYPQRVGRGENTRGWQTFSIYYGLQALPADGAYRGTVTYPVTRP